MDLGNQRSDLLVIESTVIYADNSQHDHWNIYIIVQWLAEISKNIWLFVSISHGRTPWCSVTFQVYCRYLDLTISYDSYSKDTNVLLSKQKLKLISCRGLYGICRLRIL